MSPPGFQHIFFRPFAHCRYNSTKTPAFPKSNPIQSIHIQPCHFFSCPFSSVINYPSHPRNTANPPCAHQACSVLPISSPPAKLPRPSSQLKGNHFACAPESQDLSFSASDPSAFVLALPLCCVVSVLRPSSVFPHSHRAPSPTDANPDQVLLSIEAVSQVETSHPFVLLLSRPFWSILQFRFPIRFLVPFGS